MRILCGGVAALENRTRRNPGNRGWSAREWWRRCSGTRLFAPRYRLRPQLERKCSSKKAAFERLRRSVGQIGAEDGIAGLTALQDPPVAGFARRLLAYWRVSGPVLVT